MDTYLAKFLAGFPMFARLSGVTYKLMKAEIFEPKIPPTGHSSINRRIVRKKKGTID